MVDLGRIRTKLEGIGHSGWGVVSQASGVPKSTICKIAYGVHDNPKWRTLEALAIAVGQHKKAPH